MEFNLDLLDSLNAELIDEVTLETQSFLTAFASDEAFSTNITLAFGNLIDIETVEGLRQQWSSGIFEELPKTEGHETITDFVVTDDTIDVLKAGFGGGLITGAALTAAQFRVGSRAGDSSDRFIYNRTTGALLFDADRTGAIAQVQFAQLSTGLALTNNDIFVTA